MYKIIGGDGREYGPVSAEQLRQWIAEGRADARTRVQPEGGTEWKPLSDCPEFADVLTAPATPATPGGSPPLPPVAGPVDAESLAAAILARGYSVDIGSCIGRSWALLKSNFWMLVGATFVGMLVAAGGGIPFLGPIIGLVVGGPMMGGLYLLFLKRLRGQPAGFGDAFVGFSVAFVPLMLAHIVSTLLTGLGLVLCLLPGIYLAVSWVFTLPLVIDKKIDFWAAMELSRKVVSHHWWSLFGLMIVSGLVAMLGVLGCVVGLFATIPIAWGAIAYAYEDIFGPGTAPTA